LDISGKVFNEEQPANIPPIFFTLCVLKLIS